MEIIREAEGKNLDAIAITDHDTIEGNKKAKELCRDREIKIIGGQETTTADGHLLVLGINEKIPSNLPIRETISIAREKGGFLIAPHIFHRYRHGIGGKIKEDGVEVDAVEVYNSRYITGLANKRAKWFTEKNNIPIVAGSDSHIPQMVGYGVTYVDTNDKSNILNAIKENKTRIELKKTPVSLFLNQAVSSIWREIKSRINKRF
ncbi:MAG: Metal-dependent phosphoesterase (PHP family) [Candidatus Methanohalarchaeum thermophilum]|uniref:Metal-dependent phosphoesterase (PHP family) n=1 Tax=Methanohalarchaeum thermophilum TaxID=1903181 RepID=A0A1Q6DXX3_METT1|nr:MAG: Metal-dependent phosphoesterase (PHP family) [Candidatus Methanohalarchaeum thermophilum]